MPTGQFAVICQQVPSSTCFLNSEGGVQKTADRCIQKCPDLTDASHQRKGFLPPKLAGGGCLRGGGTAEQLWQSPGSLVLPRGSGLAAKPRGMVLLWAREEQPL